MTTLVFFGGTRGCLASWSIAYIVVWNNSDLVLTAQGMTDIIKLYKGNE